MRILVCGGRDFQDRKRLYSTLDAYALFTEPDEIGNTMPYGVTIISGGAKGADSIAVDWAVVNWCPFEVYHAEWKKYGRKAGPIRNQKMIDEGKPDLVIAFKGGVGTNDMIKRALKANIKVIKVHDTHREVYERHEP